MYNLFFLIAFLLWTGCSNSGVPDNGPLKIKAAFPNLKFNRPVDLQHAGDGSNRFFVVEQAGRIFVFGNYFNVTRRTLFLDIREKVNDWGNEEGLLGLAFHPQYRQNGRFFVYYSADGPRRSVLAQYNVSGNNPNKADPNSEKIILEVNQPYSNHNGGQIRFGPDGYLYISLGDGGSGGDPQGNGQNRKTLLGSILRIDVDKTQNGKNYAVPVDNPFTGNTSGRREEIYAWGLRNVWRFTFDRVDGTLWAADVGQNRIEEIDIIEKGKNYGWNIMEGSKCFEPSENCDQRGLTLPVLDYTHEVGQSITGGFMYRGSEIPQLQGAYIYADFVSGRIWALRYDGREVTSNVLLQKTSLNISTFGEDEAGELYFCAFDGMIYRFYRSE